MEIRSTKPDPDARDWTLDDDVVRLRAWGGDRVYALPSAPEAVIGVADDCTIRVSDPSGWTSRHHARLVREHDRWILRDLGSTNGLRFDGARRESFALAPGMEIGLGGLTLVAESARLVEIRGFLARVIGWSSQRTEAVDHALRAIRMAAARRIALVLSGPTDLVSIAHALHRLTLGAARPFVACDPRRRESDGSVRAVRNHASGMVALAYARGGSLCVWSSRLPHDFELVRAVLRRPDTPVQLFVCATTPAHAEAYLAMPIRIPPLASRAREVPRIIDEYAADARHGLGAPAGAFTSADREWVREHAASSLSEIEKATLRLVALRVCGNVNRAAVRLGMAHVSLARWIGRRTLPMKLES